MCTHDKIVILLTWPPRFLKLKTMIILTVLDFNDGRVYQYDITTYKKVDTDDFEDLIVEQGHKLDDCEWMTHSDETIIKTKIEL